MRCRVALPLVCQRALAVVSTLLVFFSGNACRHVSPLEDEEARWEECAGGIRDPATGLCWQDPPAGPMSWWDASDYCLQQDIEELKFWRLPLVEELRSLIRGCGATEPGGDCPIDNFGSSADLTDACSGCAGLEGPGPAGCYWPEELGEACEGWYWTNSNLDGTSMHVWVVSYESATVDYLYKIQHESNVRCVQDSF